MNNDDSKRIAGTGAGISRRNVLQTIGGLGAAGLAGVGSASTGGMEQLLSLGENPAILVFSATEGWDHASIPTANQTIEELATEIGNENDTNITVDVVTGPAETGGSGFPTSADDLSQYNVVVWASTTGDILDAEQQSAFETYIQNGGGYMGIHAATDTEYDWSFYGDLVGAYFESHPSNQTATVNVEDRTHPSTEHLPATWERYDEWYNYTENPRSNVNVLASLDESTYNEEDGTPDQADDHPIAWYHTYQGARSFYTGLGHTENSYSDEDFRQHLKGGLMWAAGYVEGWIQLFNGENLDGWTPKISGYEVGENFNDTFTVEDGLLTANYDQYDEWDSQFGHLFYEDEYSHYMLRAEYRFVGDQAPGAPDWAFRNNGLMLHGQTPEEMGIDQDYPDSIEVQLLGTEAGATNERTTANVCTPGTDIVLGGELHTQHCTNSSSDTYRGDEWVTVTVVVRGNQQIRHYVEDDGQVMSYSEPQLEGSGAPIEQGTISIQSESHPTQFRSIELMPVDPDAPIGSVGPGSSETEPVWSSFTKTELASDLDAPMAIEVASDGRVFYTTRGNLNDDVGRIRMVDPNTGEITTLLEIDVYISGEDGLQGLVLDPNFDENGWLYTYYSVPQPDPDVDHFDRLSRFTVEDGSIDSGSETELLTIPSIPDPIAHVGGDLEFGPEGDLYLSTGDDTSPFESDNFTPIDERDGRAGFDAQRTASNTADLKGKILRISPQDDGSYTIPDGNFKQWWENETGESYSDDQVRPEIYVMGCRNPFRMGVDQETGVLYWGDYGPDSRSWNAERGPPGIVEFHRAAEPGFYGWPYFSGPNIPYVDYDFETGESGDPFDPQNPVNKSVNNDGLTELPEAQEAAIWYTYSWDAFFDSPPEYAQPYLPDEPPFPEFEGGAPMGGSIYNVEDYSSSNALSAYFDNRHFIADRGADTSWIRTVSYGENGEVTDIAPFMPDETFLRPMDMTIGPNGALYLLEWGSGYGAPNDDSGIYRISGGAEAVASVNLENGTLGEGESTTATVTVENTSDSELPSVVVSLTSDTNQVEITAPSGTSIDSIGVGESQSVEFSVSAVNDASQGSYTLNAEATFTHDGEEGQTSASTTILLFAGDPLERGLEAHFTLNDDNPVNEVTGTDATISGDVTTGVEGIIGNAYEFDVDQETGVTIPPEDATVAGGVTTESLPLNGESATVAAWFNYTDHEQWARAPFQVGGSLSEGPTNGWDIEFEDTTQNIYPQLWNNGNVGRGTGGSAITVDPGTWYFVVMVVEGGDARHHVFDQNGELDVSPQIWTGGSRTQSENEPIILGVGQGYDMAGRVDDVWAYSRALSENEVGQLHTQSLEGDDGGSESLPPGTTIELGGETNGWIGESPSSIQGQTNPTLTLEAGAEYTVTFENLDGLPHDFHIVDTLGGTQDSEIGGTGAPPEGYIDLGETASATFTATEEMVEYYCSVHPNAMRGTVEIVEGDGEPSLPPIGDSQSPPTDPDGDGLYEDINGDGEVTDADGEMFFEHFEDPEIQNNPEAFDFNGNGHLDFDDIVAWRRKRDDQQTN